MIEIQKLTKSYKKKCVVNAISFSVEKGEIFALLGSNGAGKSTTIKMILGLVKPDSGSIYINQDKVVGYSPETPYFPPFLTGKEVLEFYTRLQKLPKEAINQCSFLMEKVGLKEELSGRRGTRIKHYSKGMLQRIALAQALIGDPDLLILDEPCAGLDAMGRIEMLKLLMELKTEGKTIIMNSHILNDMEKICDRGIIMKDGKCLCEFSRSQFEGEDYLERLFVKEIGGDL